MAGLEEFKKPQRSSTGRTKPGGRKKPDPIDTGTPELGKRHKLKVERGVGVVRLRNLDGTPLDKLLFQELITPDEYAALDDFYADAFRAGMSPLKARPMWKIMGGGQGSDDQTNEQANLAAMVRDLCRVVHAQAGTSALSALMHGLQATSTDLVTYLPALRSASMALTSPQALEVRRRARR